MTEETKTFRLVYAGRRELKGGKIGYAYSRGPEEADLRLWKKPLVRNASVGAVVEVSAPADSDGSTIWTSGQNAPRLAGRLEEGDAEFETIAEWVAADRIAAVEVENARLGRKLAKEGNPVDDAIAELRQVYGGRIGYGKRAAFVAYVIAEMTR